MLIELPPDSELRVLLRQHRGNVQAIANELGINRRRVQRRIEQLGWLEQAAVMRLSARIPGQRKQIAGDDDPLGEAAAIRRTLERFKWHVDRAAAAMGYSRRTMFRRMAKFGIHHKLPPDDVRRQQVIEALEQAGGTLLGAGKILGVSRTTVDNLVKELSIPESYLTRRRKKST